MLSDTARHAFPMMIWRILSRYGFSRLCENNWITSRSRPSDATVRMHDAASMTIAVDRA